MPSPFIPLQAARIEDGLRQIGFTKAIRLQVFDNIDSTNRYLKALSPSAELELCVAESQSQGRGRLGQRWHSPFGSNIYLSLRRELPLPLSSLSGLSLVVSLALYDSLASLQLGTELKLKWPNDLLWQHRKLAGCLLEIQSTGDKQFDLIIGIGLNVNASKEQEAAIARPSCSLAQITGKAFDRNPLIAQIVSHLDQTLGQFFASGFASFQQRFGEHDYLQGQEIELQLPEKKQQGRVMGVDEQGRLLLLDKTGETLSFAIGEANLLRKLEQ